MADDHTTKSASETIKVTPTPNPKENKYANLSGHARALQLDTEYPLIDNDPHFRRVIRYFRTEDYWTWAKFTVGVPLFFSGMIPRVLGTPMIGGKYWRITAGLGFLTGFLVSYQDSCKRFWGWTENSREVKMDMEEMVARIRAGKSLYGESGMDVYHQEVSASQSRYAPLKFHIFPFMNFANHNQHGVDTEKYYLQALMEERAKGEEGNSKDPTAKEDGVDEETTDEGKGN